MVFCTSQELIANQLWLTETATGQLVWKSSGQPQNAIVQQAGVDRERVLDEQGAGAERRQRVAERAHEGAAARIVDAGRDQLQHARLEQGSAGGVHRLEDHRGQARLDLLEPAAARAADESRATLG